jgi:hypothetical protein
MDAGARQISLRERGHRDRTDDGDRLTQCPNALDLVKRVGGEVCLATVRAAVKGDALDDEKGGAPTEAARDELRQEAKAAANGAGLMVSGDARTPRE